MGFFDGWLGTNDLTYLHDTLNQNEKDAVEKVQRDFQSAYQDALKHDQQVDAWINSDDDSNDGGSCW